MNNVGVTVRELENSGMFVISRGKGFNDDIIVSKHDSEYCVQDGTRFSRLPLEHFNSQPLAKVLKCSNAITNIAKAFWN